MVPFLHSGALTWFVVSMQGEQHLIMAQPRFAPKLDRRQEEQTERLASVPAPVLHETIREQGEDELSRSPSALAWSGWPRASPWVFH